MKKFYLLLLLALPMACTTTNEETTSTLPYESGEWLLNFDVKDVTIPIHITLGEDSVMTIHNGLENIEAPMMLQGDSIYIELPHYQTYLTGVLTNETNIKGHWHNTQKGADYLVPFVAQSNNVHTDFSQSDVSKFEVQFSPNTDDQYPALALFSLNEHATGTFLTETGDYRYLAGHFIDNQLQLSCFDGSHLFHFEAEMREDSLVNGLFYSGTHWEEPWHGKLNDQFELAHPDSLTRALDPNVPFELNLMSADGDFVTMDSTAFQGKVSIIQVLGTWCPNCLDESKYYQELYAKYADQGLQIIPVAFEKSDDFETSSITVQRYLNDLGIDYPAYIGGQANKQNASKAFPMISPIISYPTSIYIDKTGRICKVHTGFYGPGTGAYYQRYTQTTDEFIQEQLNL
jgi:thiol-disulfide isomerase/thioredoxin